MMCEPDNKGQRYQESLEEKVKCGIQQGFRAWMDGGVDWLGANKAKQIGVTAVVMGRAIFCDRLAALEHAKNVK